MTAVCPLFERGPSRDGLCIRCGQPEAPHAALPLTLAPDPFAAWRALSDEQREGVLSLLIMGQGDDTPGEKAAAAALEALAAGRRP